MNEINSERSNRIDIDEDTDNLPHNLARYARTSYSKKVSSRTL